MAEKRVIAYDWLNVAACLSVVALHVNGAFWGYADEARWYVNLLIESVLYPAVPIFLMLSGATLIDYRSRYSTRVYARRRLTKVVLPYIAWSLIAIVFHVMKGTLALGDITPANLVTWLLNGSYYSVYWFFAPLFACYLAIPVLGFIPADKRVRAFGYMALLAFVTLCVMPMAARRFGFTWNLALNSPVSGGYLIYPLLGYLLSHWTPTRWQRCALYALGLGALVLRMWMTAVLSQAAGMVNYAYGSYVNYPCVLQSIAVFTAFQQIRSERHAKIVRFLSSASFSVFLTHKFMMDLLSRFALVPAWIDDLPWLYSVVWPIIVYALCFGLYWLGRRIPLVRRLFPS